MTKVVEFELFKTRYMWAKGKVIGGDLYTEAGTAPAVVVLPYRVNHDNPQSSELVLLEQHRPETGDSVIKTVGGYIKEGETPEECVQRNLVAKLGFRALDIQRGGRTNGYTVVDIPIQYFYVTEWEVVGAPQQGCAPLNTSLSGAIMLARSGNLCDDATVIPIYDLALRILGA